MTLILLLSALGLAHNTITDLKSELDDRSHRLEEAQTQAAQAMQRARNQVTQELADQREQLDQRSAALDRREAAIEEAEAIQARSTFGDGTYEVGVDIPSGTYRADAGASECYWEKLSDDAKRQILQNSVSSGPQIVTLEAGILFRTERCGTWSRSD